MTVEMINQWFGIEHAGGRFLVRDVAGVHVSCVTRGEAVDWIANHMAQIEAQDEPEASADEYLEA